MPRASGEQISSCAGRGLVIRAIWGPLGAHPTGYCAPRGRERVLERGGAWSQRPGAPGSARSGQRADLPFTSPGQSLPARSIRPLPFSLPLVFCFSRLCFPLLSSPPPFPLRMTQKENAYPWPYGRQTVRALLLTLPLPARRAPAWRGETLQKASSKHLLCHCAPRVCWRHWVCFSAATSRQGLAA